MDTLRSQLHRQLNDREIAKWLTRLGPDAFALELSSFGDDVNSLFPLRNSALSWACHVDDVEFLNVVVAHPCFDIRAPGNQKAIGDILRFDRVLHLCILLHGPLTHGSGAGLNLGRIVAECAAQGAIKCLRHLLPHVRMRKPFTTRNGTTALMVACSRGDIECVKMLLTDRSVDVNACDGAGRTALMFASTTCHVDLVAYLVSRADVDVSKADANGLCAASFAVYHSHEECVSLLVGRTSTAMLLRLHRDPFVKRELDRRRRWQSRSTFVALIAMASKRGWGRARPAYDELGHPCAYVVLRKRVKRSITQHARK